MCFRVIFDRVTVIKQLLVPLQCVRLALKMHIQHKNRSEIVPINIAVITHNEDLRWFLFVMIKLHVILSIFLVKVLNLKVQCDAGCNDTMAICLQRLLKRNIRQNVEKKPIIHIIII